MGVERGRVLLLVKPIEREEQGQGQERHHQPRPDGLAALARPCGNQSIREQCGHGAEAYAGPGGAAIGCWQEYRCQVFRVSCCRIQRISSGFYYDLSRLFSTSLVSCPEASTGLPYPLLAREGRGDRLTEPWVSVEEVAKHLGVAKDSVYRWIDHRDLPAHRIGRLWKFKLSQVDEWVVNAGAEGRSIDDGEAEGR